jgi:hypothetical protein
MDCSHKEAQVWTPPHTDQAEPYRQLNELVPEIKSLSGVDEVRVGEEGMRVVFASDMGMGNFCRLLYQNRVPFLTCPTNLREDGRY